MQKAILAQAGFHARIVLTGSMLLHAAQFCQFCGSMAELAHLLHYVVYTYYLQPCLSVHLDNL